MKTIGSISYFLLFLLSSCSETKEKIVIKVKGKLGRSMDTNSHENWKDYEGTITLNYPIFQAIGSKTEDFLY